MDSSELLKKVRKIELKTRGLSKHIFAGEYHSAFKGRGMAFSEVREYQYGDDIRNIDWNVTARFSHPYIKIFEEERELTVMLIVDVSASKVFGSKVQLKQELITELSAVLAFSAIENDDKVGIIFFSDKIEKYIPPQKGRKHILRIIRELIDFQPENTGTHIAEGLRYFTNVIKKRSTAFVISDFLDSGFSDALKIANYKHDMVALRIFDERETQMPNMGLVKLKDAETGRYMWVDTSSRKVRNSYNFWYQNNKKEVETIFLKSGIDFTALSTHEDYVKPLMKLFKRR